MIDLGDRTEDSTINFAFHTLDASNVPTTLLGTPTVEVYKAASATQSTAGVTLTVDFDTVTGLNHVSLDTSADAFYAKANDYFVSIATGTVSGVSWVGRVLATFSIQNRFGQGGATISAAFVSPARTFYLRQGGDEAVAQNIIRLDSGSTVTLAMDFSGILNEDTSISSITSVTEAGAATISNETVSQDKMKAHFDISTMAADTSYTVVATILTTDGQTIVGSGTVQT